MASKEEIKRIKHILDEATDILSESLEPARILRGLKAKHILTDSEIASINSDPQPDVRVDRLLEKLKRKDPRAYEVFLEVLCEEREDLYTAVKRIEENYDGVSSPNNKQITQTSKATPAMGKLTDKDIRCVTSKTKLLRDQLTNLYKELGLEDHEIENAERNADTRDYKLQGDKVLQYWRCRRGGKATRNAIIRSLEECDYSEAVELLRGMWKLN